MVEDLDMGKLRTIAQEEMGLMRGHNFGWKAFWDLNPDLSCLKLKLDYIAVKFSHSSVATMSTKSAGCVPSLQAKPGYAVICLTTEGKSTDITSVRVV